MCEDIRCRSKKRTRDQQWHYLPVQATPYSGRINNKIEESQSILTKPTKVKSKRKVQTAICFSSANTFNRFIVHQKLLKSQTEQERFCQNRIVNCQMTTECMLILYVSTISTPVRMRIIYIS